jgi:hypothetical protein
MRHGSSLRAQKLALVPSKDRDAAAEVEGGMLPVSAAGCDRGRRPEPDEPRVTAPRALLPHGNAG